MSTLKYKASSIVAMLQAEEIGPVWWVYEPVTKTQRNLLAKYPNNAKTDTPDVAESVTVLSGKLATIFNTNPQAVVLISFAGNANEPEDRRYTFRVCGDAYQEQTFGATPLAGLTQALTPPPGMVSKEMLDNTLQLMQQQFAIQTANLREQIALDYQKRQLEEEKKELKELKNKYDSRVESTKQAVTDAATPLLGLAGSFIKDTFRGGQVAPALAGIPEDSFAAQVATHINDQHLIETEEDVYTEAIQQADQRIAAMRKRDHLSAGNGGSAAGAGQHPEHGADDEAGESDA